MAVTTTTVNDLSAQTSTLTILSGVTIENIVYTFTTNSLVYATQSPYSLSASDFLIFAAILDAFNANLLTVFNPPVHKSTTFAVSQVVDTNDGVSQLAFQFYKTNHPLYNITATYPSGMVAFGNRNQSTTLNFDEWVYYLNVSLIYEQQVQRFFGL